MAAITYGVTANGFIRKPLSAIIDSLNSRFKAEHGVTFDTSPESPDGQIIGIVADEISQCWEQAQYAFNSYRPGAMEGVGLDAICELTGVRRYVNKPSQVTIQCTGDQGTTVPEGSVVSDNVGNEFITSNDITIPGDVTAICTRVGEIYIAPNTVNTINTDIAGWTGVNNPEEGTTGINYESDAKLRARRDKTTVSSGTNTAEAIYSALSSIDLEYVRIRDNDTTSAIGNQPPNSLYVVVDGGTVNDIARKIFDHKPAGVPTHGDIKVTIADSKGYPKDIYFSRSIKVPVYFYIELRRIAGANLSSNDVISSAATAIKEYVSTLQPGQSIAWASVVPGILMATRGIQIDSVKIGLDPNSLGTATVEMDIDQRTTTDDSCITIVDNTNAQTWLGYAPVSI